jgi:hypothetical protein
MPETVNVGPMLNGLRPKLLNFPDHTCENEIWNFAAPIAVKEVVSFRNDVS